MSQPDTVERDEPAVDERQPGRESLVTIACAQFEPRVGDIEGNREKSCSFIEDAAERGADFIVLPELANSGYVFNSREEARSLSEPIPGGETAQRWIDLADEHDAYIVGGYAEQEGEVLYNSSILVGPDGYIGTHRKVHLWNEEKLWFEPGDEIEVFETKIGRIGMQICYDQWFPELTRIQAGKGADIIAEPTNWVPINDYEQSGGMAEDELARANYLAVSNAHVNTVWFACADRVGTERGQPFLGRSLVVDPAGNPIAGPASQEEEELLLVEDCNLMDARKGKTWNDHNVIPRDRRTDLYDELCGYDDDPHAF
jgi:N-carbamoylputrescine amidase